MVYRAEELPEVVARVGYTHDRATIKRLGLSGIRRLGDREELTEDFRMKRYDRFVKAESSALSDDDDVPVFKPYSGIPLGPVRRRQCNWTIWRYLRTIVCIRDDRCISTLGGG